MADLDEILKKVGSFGWYQYRLVIVGGLLNTIVGLHMLLSVFTIAIPKHRCALPGWNNDTYAIQDEGHELYRNASIPVEMHDGKRGYSKCQVRDLNVSEWSDSGWNGEYSNMTGKPCSRWVYDRSDLTSTITEKFNLVCNRKQLRAHAQMVFFAGVLIGAVLLGVVSDIVGRKKIIFLSLILMLGSGLGAVWMPDYYGYIFIRMIDGLSIPGLLTNAFVLVVEFTEQQKRMVPGMLLFSAFFPLGIGCLAGLAAAFRDWQHLHFACSLPVALCLLLWWWVPESPRWLLSHGDLKRTESIFQEVARVNGVKVPDRLLSEKFLETNEKTRSFLENIRLLATSKILMIRAAVVCLNWMVASISYYGLSLNMGHLTGNRYMNFFIMAAIEIPVRVTGCYLLDKMGRRIFLSSQMILCGVFCLATIPTLLYAKAYPWTTLLLAVIGRCVGGNAFFSAYVITSEIFPTVIRNAIMGTGSMFARVGAMLSPYIADLSLYVEGPFSTALPLIIFGGCAIVAGCLSLILPETLNRALPQTIEDAKTFALTVKDTSEPLSNDANRIKFQEETMSNRDDIAEQESFLKTH